MLSFDVVFPRELWRRCWVTFAALLVLIPMTAKHAQADVGFQTWITQFKSEARSIGIPPQLISRAFAGVTSPDPEVLRAAMSQPEFVRPLWEYLDSAVSRARIDDGQEMLRRYATELDRIEQATGVSKYVIVAIWGIESSYGAVLDNRGVVRPVIRSLATLGYSDPDRSEFGRRQLIAALQILQRGDTTADNLFGSWAGAMGHTQFIPTTYLEYSGDYDGDGRSDIWENVPDALFSTANYLRQSGWVAGHTWGYEVRVPAGFDWQLADETTERSLAEWQQLGIARASGSAFPRPDDRATLMAPTGARGPAFLMLRNFDVIKVYNNSTSYALAVGHLADRLKGFGGFRSSFPRDVEPLSRDEVRRLQMLLTQRGFPTDGVDGKIGPNTRGAIRDFQASVGLTPDGFASSALLGRLSGS
ncbi:MAG: lytic murein transglycosylase [Pseudomonadota bacterium]